MPYPGDGRCYNEYRRMGGRLELIRYLGRLLREEVDEEFYEEERRREAQWEANHPDSGPRMIRSMTGGPGEPLIRMFEYGVIRQDPYGRTENEIRDIVCGKKEGRNLARVRTVGEKNLGGESNVHFQNALGHRALPNEVLAHMGSFLTGKEGTLNAQTNVFKQQSGIQLAPRPLAKKGKRQSRSRRSRRNKY